MRKRSTRRPIVPLPPRGLRPMLAADQVQDLSLVHIVNLDAIATGTANVELLWQTMAGIFTWSRIAQRLGRGEEQMAEQLFLYDRVHQRYARTNRVLFTGEEYQLAKRGVEVMNELAVLVDRPTALEAADWSEREINRRMATLNKASISSFPTTTER